MILVTTKRPRQQKGAVVEYSFNLGVENSISRPQLASMDDYLDAYEEAGFSSKYFAGNGEISRWRELLAAYRKGERPDGIYPNGIYKDEDGRVYWLSEKNMYKRILTTGALQNHNVSISGGNDRIRFRMSAGLSREDGPLITSKDKYMRKNISAFVSADVNKWFTQEVNLL